eukprot:scaffold39887_cov229-Amphora_coffeaeformis.AAC.2
MRSQIATALEKGTWWMPFTANKAFRVTPRIVDRAQGMMLYTAGEQKPIIDAVAGLWCSNLGHCRPEIADAVQKQLMKLDFCSSFNTGHDIGFEYAERLVQYTPEGMDHVFFGNSGSEAVETSLKIALQYWTVKGQPEKRRFIGREKGYHGVNFGGISVGGIPNNFKTFGQWLDVDHLPHTLDIERNAFSRGLPLHGVEKADELEKLLLKYGPETVAALIIEPVTGAGGVIPPPVGYLKRIKEICDQYDILLIFDEVISGWGRMGAPFAAQQFDVMPDMITSAKGITNAAVPLSAVFCSNDIYNTCMNEATAPVEFFHGYTYSAHPVACAAGMASLDVYEAEGLLTRAGGPIAQYWEDALHTLADLPQVIDVRNYGLIGAVELQDGPSAMQGQLGPYLAPVAWEEGVAIRGLGDAIGLSPPLIIEEEHIDRIVEVLRKVIKTL